MKIRKISWRSVSVVAVLALLMLVTVVLCGCGGGDQYPNLDAKRFVGGILQSGGFAYPDRLCAKGEEDYDLQFEAYYNGVEAGMITDGALAYCSGIRAEEISLLIVSDNRYIEPVRKALQDHLDREHEVYVKYSAEDAAKIKSAKIYVYGKYVFLVVSDTPEEVRRVIERILKDPDCIPAGTGTETGDEASKEPDETGESTESQASVGYRWDAPVPERDSVSEGDWMGKTVLIGDSRLYGLYYYLHPQVLRCYAFESLSINGIFNKELVETENGKITVADALAQTPDFDTCYLMFGTNELGWPSTDTFLTYYGRLIDRIREVNPDAQIYLMAIYPVEEAKVSNYKDVFTNEKIRSVNEKLLSLAAEKKVYYLDSYEALADASGSLPSGSTNDGIHVGTSLCRKLLDYMLSHTVDPSGAN